MAETGHAKNVANFATMISFCQGYGTAYQPTNAELQIPALQTLLASAEAALDDVAAKLAPWKDKVADRENIFVGIRPLSTRVLNAFAVCGAEDNKVDNVKTQNRLIHGARAKALPKDDPSTPEDESKGNSVSHRSYVQVAEAFGTMIELLEEEGDYKPNETDLQTTSLNTLHGQMESANSNVVANAVPLSNSRIARNEVLYADDTGLCDRAGLVKKYVKSVFGAGTPQFEQISGLQFTAPRTH